MILLRQFLRSAFLAGLLSSPLWAVPPVPGREGPGGKTCYVNAEAAAERAAAYRSALRVGAFPAPPSNPTPRVLVIRVDFSNKAMTQTFAEAKTFTDQVRAFYSENSYGTFLASFTVTNNGSGSLGAYRLPGTLATYGADCGGDVACRDCTLRNDALTEAQAVYGGYHGGANFNGFTHLMILHAGDGQEASGTGNDIWSVFVPQSSCAATALASFPGFTVVPESEAGVADPLGVIAHEYGHQMGLPDIYDTSVSGGSTTAGTWEIMDTPYAGSPLGANPPHFSVWSRLFLGFVSTTTTSGRVVSETVADKTIESIEDNSNGFLFVPAGSVSSIGSQEYFLVEYRRPDSARMTYDLAAPTTGLVIWHIDGSLVAENATQLADNTVNAPSLNGAGHRGVDLVEQGGGSTSSGKASDAFRDGHTFKTTQSDAFNSQQTGIVLDGISATGTTPAKTVASADFTNLNISTGSQTTGPLSIIKVINYPNPAGESCPSKSAGILTTFVLQTNKDASNRTLDIYDLLGNRVRNVESRDIQFQSAPTQTNKWVYEYDWDGKTGGGDSVAPGVYLYRFKADGQAKTGKLVVVR